MCAAYIRYVLGLALMFQIVRYTPHGMEAYTPSAVGLCFAGLLPRGQVFIGCEWKPRGRKNLATRCVLDG